MLFQAIVNGWALGSLIGILGVGYAIIARSGIAYHFAHAAVFTIGAFAFQVVSAHQSIPSGFSVIAAGLVAIATGLVIEGLVYRRLRRRKASRLIVLLSSFGLYIVLQNLISLGFGDASRSVSLWRVQEGWQFCGARVTGLQIAVSACAAAIMVLATWWSGKTETGRAARAIGSDPSLADIIGVNTTFTLAVVMGIGSVIAGMAGVLSACDAGVYPTMGLMPFFAALVGVIVARESVIGTALACVAIGVLQQVVILWTDAAWQDPIVFVVLVLTLLVRPQGVTGRTQHKVPA